MRDPCPECQARIDERHELKTRLRKIVDSDDVPTEVLKHLVTYAEAFSPPRLLAEPVPSA